jgi:hypothetical protein
MSKFLRIAALGALTLVALGAVDPVGSSSSRELDFLPHLTRAAHTAPARSLALNSTAASVAYYGGWVMQTNTTYAIYWAPSGFAFPPRYGSTIDDYLTNVAAASGSMNNVYSVATQYSDSTGPIAYSSTFGGSYVDTSSFPAAGCSARPAGMCLTDQQAQDEIQNAINANAWPTGQTSLFFLMLPNGVAVCADGSSTMCTTSPDGFCAYHSSFSAGDAPVVYSVEPYVAAINGCNDTALSGAPNGAAADAVLNTISHEQIEAGTDPWNNGWQNPNGSEISDICEWRFGLPIGTTANGQPYNQLINGHPYALQEAWSNDGHACVQALDAVQAKPANARRPAIVGRPRVGRDVHASPGRWVGHPWQRRYQWLLCNGAGRLCKRLARATRASYRPTAREAGDRLRVRVVVTDVAGSTTALSGASSRIGTHHRAPR